MSYTAQGLFIYQLIIPHAHPNKVGSLLIHIWQMVKLGAQKPSNLSRIVQLVRAEWLFRPRASAPGSLLISSPTFPESQLQHSITTNSSIIFYFFFQCTNSSIAVFFCIILFRYHDVLCLLWFILSFLFFLAIVPLTSKKHFNSTAFYAMKFNFG